MSNSLFSETYLENLGGDICSPFFDKYGSLHVVYSDSGEVAVIRGDSKIIHSTNGQASSAAFDNSGTLYVTDYAHSAVLMASQNKINKDRRDLVSDQQEVIVAVYEDKPLRGPSSISFDNNGNIFFTDSGPLGETGLHSPVGSLFVISSGVSGQLLKPIVFEKLASPSAVCVSPDNNFMSINFY